MDWKSFRSRIARTSIACAVVLSALFGVANPAFVVVSPTASGTVAGDLARDGAATPHQLALIVENLGGLASTATAEVRIREGDPEGSFSNYRQLYRVETTNPPTPPWGAIDDVFAWTLFGLTPCTEYDVQLRKIDGATTDDDEISVFTTKCLPAEPGAVDATITATANIQSTLNAASPGDHIQFANGTYDMSGISWPAGLSGSTESAPTYITGASRAGVILQETDQDYIVNLDNDISNVVFQDLTLEGSGADEQPGFTTSTCFYSPDGDSATNITIRRTTCTGVNRGGYFYGPENGADEHSGILVYNNTIEGNNAWSESPSDYFFTGLAWDDYGISISGNGIAVFSNDITGFGDTFSTTSGSGGSRSEEDRSQHFYWNDINISLDDGFEADDGFRNLSVYQNRWRNAINMFSVDPVYGGPLFFWGNIAFNVAEIRVFKWNTESSGMFVYNNTVLSRDKLYRSGGASAGGFAVWYQPGGATQEAIAVANNIFLNQDALVSDGGGTDTLWGSSFWNDPVDAHHNAWFPDEGFQLGDGDTSGNTLALFQADQPAADGIFEDLQRFENDVVTIAQPFTSTITLPADARTELTTEYGASDVVASDSSITNAGIAIEGITNDFFASETFSGGAPDIGAVVAGLTYPTVGDETNMPAFAQGMADYDVRYLTGSFGPAGGNETVEDVTPTEWINSDPGNIDVRGVIDAYSGGAGAIFSDWTDAFVWVHGGGHNDSANNGAYVYELREVAGLPAGWEDPVDISAVADVNSDNASNPTYDDGYPPSAHTYAAQAYSESRDLIYRIGGSRYNGNGDFLDELWSYDRNAAVGSRWTNVTTNPGGAMETPLLAYDPESDKLIAFGSDGQLAVYDIAGDTWSTVRSVSLDGFDSGYGYDHTRNQVIGFSRSNGQVVTYELDLSDDTVTNDDAVTFTGTTNIVSEPLTSYLYDEALDVFWVFGGETYAEFDEIACFDADQLQSSPSSVSVSEFSLSNEIAETSIANDQHGSNNRFTFIKSSRHIIAVENTDDPPALIKLPSTETCGLLLLPFLRRRKAANDEQWRIAA